MNTRRLSAGKVERCRIFAAKAVGRAHNRAKCLKKRPCGDNIGDNVCNALNIKDGRTDIEQLSRTGWRETAVFSSLPSRGKSWKSKERLETYDSA